MVPVPIRCRIPELLKKIGQNQQWLADKTKMSKQQLSDYVTMRNIPGLIVAKRLSRLLKCNCVDDLHVWEWREE